MCFDDIEEYTVIQGSKPSPTEQLDNAPLMLDGIAKGLIPPTLKHANEYAEKLGWSQLSKAEWDEAMETKARSSVTLGPGSPAQGGPGRPDGPGTDPRGRDDEDSQRMVMAEKKTLFGGSLPSARVRSWPWLRSTTS